MIDTTKIQNETVRKAIEALQSGDAVWYNYFVEQPEMTDDGRPKDFKSFFDNALGTERFLTIDTIKNDGRDIYGNFKAGQWGTFRVYFKFTLNDAGKITQLDIGQTGKLS